MSHKTYFLIFCYRVRMYVRTLNMTQNSRKDSNEGTLYFYQVDEILLCFLFLHKKERYRKTINILCYHILCKYSCMLKIHFQHFLFLIFLLCLKSRNLLVLFYLIKNIELDIFFLGYIKTILIISNCMYSKN